MCLISAVWTAAVMNLPHAENLFHSSPVVRSVEIMADAAYGILTKTSSDFTGKFLFDEDFLRDSGITDFSQYELKDASKL